jgi:hypothetical protein
MRGCRSITAEYLPYSLLEPWHWQQKLCLTARGTSPYVTGRTVCRKSRCQWAVRLSEKEIYDSVLDANSIRIDAVAGTVTIFPIPGVTVVEVKHKVTREVRFSCPQNVVNKTDPQCAHALAICKIVLSKSGIDETARHELLQRLLPGMGPILLWYHVSSTALVP